MARRLLGLGRLGGVDSTSVLSLTSLKLPLSSDSAPASQFVDECPGPRQRADSAQQVSGGLPGGGGPENGWGGSEIRVTASSLQLQLRACSFLPHSHPTFFWCLHRFPAPQGKQESGADLLRLASSVQQSPALSPTLSPHLGLCMCVKVCLCVLSASRCG